jgi:hypothetical protein
LAIVSIGVTSIQEGWNPKIAAPSTRWRLAADEDSGKADWPLVSSTRWRLALDALDVLAMDSRSEGRVRVEWQVRLWACWFPGNDNDEESWDRSESGKVEIGCLRSSKESNEGAGWCVPDFWNADVDNEWVERGGYGWFSCWLIRWHGGDVSGVTG